MIKVYFKDPDLEEKQKSVSGVQSVSYCNAAKKKIL